MGRRRARASRPRVLPETSGGDDLYLYGWPKEVEGEAPGRHERLLASS